MLPNLSFPSLFFQIEVKVVRSCKHSWRRVICSSSQHIITVFMVPHKIKVTFFRLQKALATTDHISIPSLSTSHLLILSFLPPKGYLLPPPGRHLIHLEPCRTSQNSSSLNDTWHAPSEPCISTHFVKIQNCQHFSGLSWISLSIESNLNPFSTFHLLQILESITNTTSLPSFLGSPQEIEL